MVHDVSRALMWLFTFSINMAQKNLEIPTRYNSIYTQKDVLRALTFLSLEREYAEGGLKRLTNRNSASLSHMSQVCFLGLSLFHDLD
jgi:hypothetical protein